jgi:hypothetical protein
MTSQWQTFREPRSTWAEVISIAMCIRAALGDTSAAKEIREVTEGRTAHVANVGDQIDYSAGRSAKEMLMSKLEPRKG